jgi:hypothetical protein
VLAKLLADEWLSYEGTRYSWLLRLWSLTVCQIPPSAGSPAEEREMNLNQHL